ncbi:MAG: class I SAM-dependent methyltransferase [Candidatus Thorarchaeota archaeon]|nr:class I SAM-dependent methyltransferase [Candidatus Thorarchaeota archaeon]
MGQYYTESLSAERLKRCYEIAPPRTIQYLEAEAQYVLSYISSNDRVLELGCGYGRFLEQLVAVCQSVVGIDISLGNLIMAERTLGSNHHLGLVQMNSSTLGFSDGEFDAVLCIQNGISAFKIDPLVLIRESIRLTRPEGVCIFTSYSDKFWKPRLDWFRLQSEEGLLREIDWDATQNGVIVCKDGFRATTYRPEDFRKFADIIGVESNIVEIDGSSICCVIKV